MCITLGCLGIAAAGLLLFTWAAMKLAAVEDAQREMMWARYAQARDGED